MREYAGLSRIEALYQINSYTSLSPELDCKKILLVGIDEDISEDMQFVPYLFNSPRKVCQTYGYEDLSRAYYEVYKQGAPFVATAAVSGEDLLPTFLDYAVGWDIDIVCFAGIYYSAEFSQVLSPFLEKRLRAGYPVITTMAVSGDYNTAIGTDWYGVQHYADSIGFDSSPFLILTYGDISYEVNTLRQYLTTGATAMAGLLSTLPAGRSPVNKSTQKTYLIDEFTDSQVEALFNAGLNTFVNNPARGVVPVGGRTISQQDYLDIVHIRLAQLTILTVRRAVEGYIGESPNITAVRSSVDAAMKSLIAPDALIDCSYDLRYDAVRGEIEIDAYITPRFTLRTINVSTNILMKRTYG